MALMDLSSDLSNFRSEVSREPKNTPESSKATNNKNFATFQPITAKLSQFAMQTNRQEPKKLEERLGATKLDDIRKFAQENLLVNSVSQYSNINEEYAIRGGMDITTEMVTSKYSNIRIQEFVSNFTKSNIIPIKQTQGTFNTTSNVAVERSQYGENNLTSPVSVDSNNSEATGNVVNPNIQISRVSQTLDRAETSPELNIVPNDYVDNVVNPDVEIVAGPLTFDRASQSVVISKDIVSPTNNITDPKTILDINTLTYERSEQSPTILTDTKQDGFVKNPDIRVFRFDGTSIQTNDGSRLNIDGLPLRFIPISRLDRFELPREIDIARYDGVSVQTEDNSNLNVDSVVKTIPSGRHENPEGSGFSIIGTQQVNFFQDRNAKGFVVRQQLGESLYTGNSQYGWNGKRESAPTTNFLTDINGRGFTKFAQAGISDYDENSSNFGFTTPQSTDFFDIVGQHTADGFKLFATLLESDYKVDVSQYGFTGKEPSPVNYFDVTNKVSSDGFTNFAQIYDTKYIPDASIYTWAGAATESPQTNYFDITNQVTTAGFHKFSQLYDSKYVANSSQFDWDGGRQDAPETNYFDVTGTNTTAGFHKFSQLYDSKYVDNSSQFDWDGGRQDAPETNYFDVNGTNTTVGFHKFAQLYDSKYSRDSSIFDFDGGNQDAPTVDYFDISKVHTTNGFEKFPQALVTRYVKDSSRFDFDGNRQDAPTVDYFDISRVNTTEGFEKFPQALVTRYVKDSSRFDFDGNKQEAPETDFFDILKKYAAKGFEKFPQRLVTRYNKDASEYDWNGGRSEAPTINFFQNTQATGFTKFAPKLESEYKRDVSEFTFRGSLPKKQDFLDNTNASGFTLKAAPLSSEYVKESSKFTFKGTVPRPVDFITNEKADGFNTKINLYDSKYKRDVSEFTFKGASRTAPAVNYFADTTTNGFTTFPANLETKYVKDVSTFTFKGTRQDAPSTDYLTNTSADGFTNLVEPLSSRYKKNTSRFTWNGTRETAPEVNFFGIQGENPQAVSGFDRLFTDGTLTKLSDNFSRFSFSGTKKISPNKNAPYTTFFGFKPSERSGFMTGMVNGEQTLYPIIDPSLRFDEIPSRRFEIETSRGQRKRLQTSRLEDYAPNSLGKRPFGDDGKFATLDSQVPNIKTNAPAGSFSNKYESSLRDGTDRRGYLAKWAITRRSPSPLDEQYSKFKLQADSTNNEPAFFYQPYVVRGIQRDGEVENQRWGFGVSLDEGILRGGATTHAERIAMDVVRLGKWTASAKGLIFNLKQLGLQAMNPTVDVDPNNPSSGVFGVSSTLLFNPLSILGNVVTARAGAHFARHGILPTDSAFLNKYETATNSRELNQRFSSETNRVFDNLELPVIPGQQTKYNRLIGLMRELLPNTFKPTTGVDGSPTLLAAAELTKQLLGKPSISRLSSIFGGAQSFLGIGGTTIRRASHPYLATYTTSPNLQGSVENGNTLGEAARALSTLPFGAGSALGAVSSIVSATSQTQPQYEESAKRDTFFAHNYRYSENFKSTRYNGLLSALGQAIGGPSVKDASDIKPNAIQNDTLQRINGLQPYDPTEKLGSYRTDATTANNAENQIDKSKKLNSRTLFSSSYSYGKAYKDTNGFLAIKGLSYQLSGSRQVNETQAPSAPVGIQKETLDVISKLSTFSPKYRKDFERVTAVNSLNAGEMINEIKLLSDGPLSIPDGDFSSVNAIKRYRTANYDKLKRNDRRGSRFFNDFRASLTLDNTTATYITDPSISRFDTRNLTERYGFGAQGAPGEQRSIPYLSTIDYQKFDKKDVFDQSGPANFRDYGVPAEKTIQNQKQFFRGDRINIIDYKRANVNLNTNLVYEKDGFTNGIRGTEDLVEFYFSSLVLFGHNNCPAEAIVFRATFDSITDNHKPSWNSVKYMGRADPLYVYQGYEREISFGFTVHIGSRDEMKASWRKLNYLASWTAPEYTKAGYIRGPMVRLNIGHLYRKMPGYISSLSYTFDNQQGTWETAKLPEDMNLGDPTVAEISRPGVLQLPKTVNVSVSFVPVGVYRPEFRGVMYSLYDDRADSYGGRETGLIPRSANRVNYFTEYYEQNGQPKIISGRDADGVPYEGISEFKILTEPVTDTDGNIVTEGAGNPQPSPGEPQPTPEFAGPPPPPVVGPPPPPIFGPPAPPTP